MGNPVVHVELIGPDPARLRAFYSQLFGWDAPAASILNHPRWLRVRNLTVGFKIAILVPFTVDKASV